MGKILRREGAYYKVATMFYRAMVQVILLFGSDSWVLTAAMGGAEEGKRTGFLKKITGKRAWWEVDGMWYAPRAEEVRESGGTQLKKTYLR